MFPRCNKCFVITVPKSCHNLDVNPKFWQTPMLLVISHVYIRESMIIIYISLYIPYHIQRKWLVRNIVGLNLRLRHQAPISPHHNTPRFGVLATVGLGLVIALQSLCGKGIATYCNNEFLWVSPAIWEFQWRQKGKRRWEFMECWARFFFRARILTNDQILNGKASALSRPNPGCHQRDQHGHGDDGHLHTLAKN